MQHFPLQIEELPYFYNSYFYVACSLRYNFTFFYQYIGINFNHTPKNYVEIGPITSDVSLGSHRPNPALGLGL